MGKISKTVKEKGKATFDGPKVKSRKKFAPKTKAETPKKGKGSFKRKKDAEVVEETNEVCKFLESLLKKDYSSAHKIIKNRVEEKLAERIAKEMQKPLF